MNNENNPAHFNHRKNLLEIDQLKALLKVGYEIDAPMLLPITRSLFFGYRRSENFGRDKSGGMPADRSIGMTGLHSVQQTWLSLFPEHQLTSDILPFSRLTYELRIVAIRERAGLACWGNNGLRRHYLAYTMWGGVPSNGQSLLGHFTGDLAVSQHYNDRPTAVWAREYERLTPLNVLGYEPTPLTPEQMKASRKRKQK